MLNVSSWQDLPFYTPLGNGRNVPETDRQTNICRNCGNGI
jgi:hypothetical protein